MKAQLWLTMAAAADNAVVEALAAKGNPAIRKREAAASRAGEAKGKADAILSVLAARGIAVSAAQSQQILRCADLARLDRWSRRAALASPTEDVLANS